MNKKMNKYFLLCGCVLLIFTLVGCTNSASNSVPIYSDPCKNVVCSNICSGYALWSQKCDKGNCVPYQQLSSCSESCGCVPKISISSLDTDVSWNLSEGFVATAYVSLSNFGPADGTARIEFYNDRNQILAVEDYWVPSQGSKSFVKKLDISMEDKSVGARVRSQWKS